MLVSVSPDVSSQRAIVIQREYVEIGGDLVVGALLSQIAYWCRPNDVGKTRMRVQRDGVYWVAKTREEWMSETGLTLDQYKRAITVLKRKGLVDVRVMRFNGLAMSHVRLIASALPGSGGGKPTIHLVANPPTAWGHPHHPSTESTAETTSISGANEQTETEGGMKASEILKQPKKEGALGAFWQSRCATVMGGYQKPLTLKEMGQLKQLHGYLGERTREVIDYALNNWWKFASRAGAESGMSYPTSPHIGYLLKHHAVAVNLLTPGVAEEMESTASQKPTVAPSIVQSIATEDAPHALTKEELEEMLAGLQE